MTTAKENKRYQEQIKRKKSASARKNPHRETKRQEVEQCSPQVRPPITEARHEVPSQFRLGVHHDILARVPSAHHETALANARAVQIIPSRNESNRGDTRSPCPSVLIQHQQVASSPTRNPVHQSGSKNAKVKNFRKIYSIK